MLSAMEAKYKMAARTAQFWVRDSASGPGGHFLSALGPIKEQLYKVNDKIHESPTSAYLHYNSVFLPHNTKLCS